jgi:hypothetical protein
MWREFIGNLLGALRCPVHTMRQSIYHIWALVLILQALEILSRRLLPNRREDFMCFADLDWNAWQFSPRLERRFLAIGTAPMGPAAIAFSAPVPRATAG